MGPIVFMREILKVTLPGNLQDSLIRKAYQTTL